MQTLHLPTLHMYPDHLTQLKHKAQAMPQHQNHVSQLHLTFPGTDIAVRKALADTLAALRFLDLSSDEAGTVELVLAEVMNNIVEHAFADNPDGMIELGITPMPNGLSCVLCDDGHPMPDGMVPLGGNPSLDCDLGDLPEGGFGWFLIRDLAHDLKYTRSSGKNRLTFRISVGHAQFQA